MYEDYLKALLAPLRVYDLRPGTINGAELYALGKGFDGVSEQLDLTEREALTATAEDEGLSRREHCLPRRPAAFTPEERRAAIAALLQIDGDSLTPRRDQPYFGRLRHPGSGQWRWAAGSCGLFFQRWQVSRRSLTRFRGSFWTFCPVIWRQSSIFAT